MPRHARDAILPGNELITCWYVAMACIEHNFGAQYQVRVDIDRYRYLQVLYLDRKAGRELIRALWSRLSAGERIRYGAKRAWIFLVSRLLRGGTGARIAQRTMDRDGMFPRFDPRKHEVEFRNILELFENWGVHSSSLQ